MKTRRRLKHQAFCPCAIGRSAPWKYSRLMPSPEWLKQVEMFVWIVQIEQRDCVSISCSNSEPYELLKWRAQNLPRLDFCECWICSLGICSGHRPEPLGLGPKWDLTPWSMFFPRVARHVSKDQGFPLVWTDLPHIVWIVRCSILCHRFQRWYGRLSSVCVVCWCSYVWFSL